ncbi:MAG TPA: hypothetical protein VEG38_17160 [Acidimicrobiia bacterium]|nr:hypothetical protein [Acidimicrobiia bacterium]
MENEAHGTAGDEIGGNEEHSLLQSVIERARGTGVGTEDPNIVGDAGPTDVPPGKDPDPEWPPPETP